jgi:transcriptional regulator with XRE-family HTH domain
VGSQNLAPTARSAEDVFLDRLEELVAKVGSQERASGLAGVAAGTFSRWRNRKRKVNPDLSTLVRIAEALNVPVGEMVSDPGADAPRRGIDPDHVQGLLNELREEMRGALKVEIVGAIDRVTERIGQVARLAQKRR